MHHLHFVLCLSSLAMSELVHHLLHHIMYCFCCLCLCLNASFTTSNSVHFLSPYYTTLCTFLSSLAMSECNLYITYFSLSSLPKFKCILSYTTFCTFLSSLAMFECILHCTTFCTVPIFFAYVRVSALFDMQSSTHRSKLVQASPAIKVSSVFQNLALGCQHRLQW